MRSVYVLTLLATCLLSTTVARPSQNEDRRLIQLSEEDQGQWLTQKGIMALKRAHINFRDITDRAPSKAQNLAREDRIPEEVLFQTATSSAIAHLSLERTQTFLNHFTSYFNRLYSSATGVESTLWLHSEIQSSIADSRYNGSASVELFPHPWLQPSVVARIDGADPTISSEVVILGGHLDSMNFNSARPAPGADDNGSGSGALLEALRGLLYSDFIPRRTIEFHWYAAEEVGLLGSGEIADYYEAEGVDVVSMMNFDVTGYNAGRNDVGINTDFVNPKLTAFLRLVVEEYLDYGWADRRCNYACSDHASFFYAGFLVAFPSELTFFPDMHTERDTVDRVSFEQIHEFTKLAVGYAVELGQPHIA